MDVAEGKATCEFCREDVEHNDPHACFEIIGWEAPRKQGGTNVVHLKRRTGACLHFGCLQKLLMGAKRGPIDNALF